MNWRTTPSLILVGAYLLSSASFALAKLSCYEDPTSLSTTCFDEQAVSINGGIRSARIYTGGPRGVRSTNFSMVVDCAKRIVTLQDSDGVNFAGGFDSTTTASRSLSGWICEAKKPKKNPRLRQF